MLLDIVTWLIASRCVTRPVASSTPWPSSSSQCSRDSSAAGDSLRRSCSWSRTRKSGGGVAIDSESSAMASTRVVAPALSASRSRAAHPSAAASSSRRFTVRRVIRRTLSTRPRRSMAGSAQSSPMSSGATSWKAETKRSSVSRSTRASVWEMRAVATW